MIHEPNLCSKSEKTTAHKCILYGPKTHVTYHLKITRKITFIYHHKHLRHTNRVREAHFLNLETLRL